MSVSRKKAIGKLVKIVYKQDHKSLNYRKVVKLKNSFNYYVYVY